jgi:hypothetical protein
MCSHAMIHRGGGVHKEARMSLSQSLNTDLRLPGLVNPRLRTV